MGLVVKRTATDAAPAKAFAPLDMVDRGVSADEVSTECRDAEHAAAIGEQPPVAAARAVAGAPQRMGYVEEKPCRLVVVGI